MTESLTATAGDAAQPKLITAVVDAKAGSASVAISANTLLADALPSASPVDPISQSLIDTESANRELRRPMAWWAIGVTSGQLLVMNVCLILIGAGALKFDTSLFHWYMGESFGALLGVALVVFKYLFPTTVRRRPK